MRSASASILAWPMVRGQRLDLAVDVRFGHVVEVDQGQRADRAARQRLDDPGTDPADADHANVRRAEALQRGLAVQPRDAAETAFEIDLFHYGAGNKIIDGFHPPILTDVAARTVLKCPLFNEEIPRKTMMTNALPDTAPGFDQPIAVLKHCHDRIRKQLATMQKLPAHLARHGADEQARQAAQAVIKYFDKAAHLHHADEEENLVPMLQAVAQGEDAATLAALVPGILHDHDEMDAMWQSLHEELSAIADGSAATLSAPTVQRFAERYTRPHGTRGNPHRADGQAPVQPGADGAAGRGDAGAARHPAGAGRHRRQRGRAAHGLRPGTA